jgi:hypothetical protein
MQAPPVLDASMDSVAACRAHGEPERPGNPAMRRSSLAEQDKRKPPGLPESRLSDLSLIFCRLPFMALSLSGKCQDIFIKYYLLHVLQ